jgi:hypothetical protein
MSAPWQVSHGGLQLKELHLDLQPMYQTGEHTVEDLLDLFIRNGPKLFDFAHPYQYFFMYEIVVDVRRADIASRCQNCMGVNHLVPVGADIVGTDPKGSMGQDKPSPATG